MWSKQDAALVAFRFVSWTLTSGYYVVRAEPGGSLGWKLSAAGALLVAAAVSAWQLRRAAGRPRQVAVLTLAETAALPALLAFTGGLGSPFVWYALNPLLVAALYLPVLYTWLVVATFLAGASVATVLGPLTRARSLTGYGEVVVVIVLVTLATQVQAGLLARLEAGQRRLRRTLDHLKGLHQLVESAGSSRDDTSLLELVTLYARQLTGAETAVYWAADGQDPETLAAAPAIVAGATGQDGALTTRVAQCWAGREDQGPESVREHIACATIRSSSRRFGVLAARYQGPVLADIDLDRTVALLGCIAGAMLERRRAEELHAGLLVAEEQARIAAEIHDGVAQSLFSLVCGLQGAMRSVESGERDQALATLRTLRDVAAGVSREIRASIHRLRRLDGEGAFVGAVRSFLDGLGNLYGASTQVVLSGSEDNLSPALRLALYRIVREAASNAMRHGGARELRVSLSMGPDRTVTEVADDGRGFATPGPDLPPGGLGLVNMGQLARSFGGSLRIESSPGNGATVTVRIPDHSCGAGRDEDAG